MPTGFENIIVSHLSRYPLMGVDDVYKLAHQACLGSAHAVPDTRSAQEALDRELERLGDGPPEPAADPISPDGSVLRVHLRPWLVAGGDADLLLQAFVRTANEHEGSAEQLAIVGAEVTELCRSARLPFAQSETRELWRRMAAIGFPPIHHSAVYTDAYRPAYRVVAAEFIYNHNANAVIPRPGGQDSSLD